MNNTRLNNLVVVQLSQQYITRSGFPVDILTINKALGEKCVVGLMHKYYPEVFQWTIHGRYVSDKETHWYDLVRVENPVVQEWIANIYPDMPPMLYATQDEADIANKNLTSKRIGCVAVHINHALSEQEETN